MLLHADVATRIDGALAAAGDDRIGGGGGGGGGAGRGVEMGRRRRVNGVGRGAQSLLELEQLAHKIQIGRDDGSPLLDHRVRLDQTQRGVAHQIGDRDSRRPRYAGVTVNQNGSITRPGLICCKRNKKKKQLTYLLSILHYTSA